IRTYREALAAAGHAPDVLRHCMQWSTVAFLSCVVAETDAEAQRQLEIAFDEMIDRRKWTERHRLRAHAFTTAADPTATEPPRLADFGSLAGISKTGYLWRG